MTDSLSLGEFKSKHAPSKAFFYLAIVIFVLFTGISGLIYSAILSVEQGKSNFNGDISVLYYSIAFIMLMAIVILLFAIKATKGKTYYIHTGGIIAEDKAERKTLLFSTIDDVYVFRSGKSFVTNNVAFRNRTNGEWEVITARYNGATNAVETIKELHKVINTPVYMERMDNGKGITFQYISYKTAVAKQLFATGTSSFLNVKPKDIVLYKDRLVIDDQEVMLHTLIRFSTNEFLSQINIYNKENQVVFSTATNGIFSGYTFVTLLDILVNQQKELSDTRG